MKVMYLIMIISFFSNKFIAGQNLIPNPGFEDYSDCPTPSTLGWITLSIPWEGTTYPVGPAFSNYYNICGSGPWQLPSYNFESYQFPHSGQGMADTRIFNADSATNPNQRGYLHSELVDTLINDHIYYLEFFVNLRDACGFGVNRIGAFFSDTSMQIYLTGDL